MPWFSVHAIIAFKKDDSTSPEVYGYENIYLIEAETHEAAEIKAMPTLIEEANVSDDSRVDNVPVKLCHVAIRKTISIFNTDNGDNDKPPSDGSEFTYFDLEFPDERNFFAYLSNEPFSANSLT